MEMPPRRTSSRMAEEDGDELVAVAAFDEPLQLNRRSLFQPGVELRHFVRDFVQRSLQLDRLRMIDFVARQRGAEGVDEIEERDFADVDLGWLAVVRDGRARKNAHAHDVELREGLGDRFEALILEQSIDELRARIFESAVADSSRGRSIFDLMWMSSAAM